MTLKSGLEVTQGHCSLCVVFLFAFHGNYGYICILYHFHDKARYWLKVAFFPLGDDLPLGQSPLAYGHTVWSGKTRMAFSPTGEKRLRIRLAISTKCRHVTDGQTDILRQHSPHYA